MASKAVSSLPFFLLLLLLLAALSVAGGRGRDLCPPLDDIGHAAPQAWVFSGLDWTLTQISSGQRWPPAADDFDESRVAFRVQSDFNAAPTLCSGQGREFSEEYTRQLAGVAPTYAWYECEGAGGGGGDVKTEFRMVWWNTHTVEIRQTWTCPATGRPMRATGQLAMREFDCVFDGQSRRTSCTSRAGSQLRFDATIVEVLPAPTRHCAAASVATPGWAVPGGLAWVRRTTTFGLDPGSANLTFGLASRALAGYSPRMACAAPALLPGPRGGVYRTPYACAVFEANEADVPVTEFDWVLDDGRDLLRINQTWYCDDGAANEIRFQSIGERDVKPLLSCSSESRDYEIGGGTFVETFTTCVAEEGFEIEGVLQ
ncbi:hypothetical protein SAMD00023353_2000520 [Rosellinia necatrix]|uniref:Uncharacterized protein n=1 Tax=Rosellinia necatrix TaxID=77044 RepID=A0A1W2TF55_ROSNE|nr:hypothetical protein SAMD00023353_2000520 [Rosellinia necatrix]